VEYFGLLERELLMNPETILGGLVQRGIPLHIAQGMVANMMVESRLDPGINEIAPIVPGSRGGYGLNQWTGPRRRQFEEFAQERGASFDDLNTQLDFTLWELQNTERGAWNALQGADDPVEAARIYSERFLRPGIPHLDRRLDYARQFAGMEPDSNALAAPQMDRMAQFNALAAQMTPFKATKLNVFRI
jgi:hypothetical protein